MQCLNTVHAKLLYDSKITVINRFLVSDLMSFATLKLIFNLSLHLIFLRKEAKQVRKILCGSPDQVIKGKQHLLP